MKKNVIVLSYVPPYNRQGVDLAHILRGDNVNVRLYQLNGVTNIDSLEFGVPWLKPHGVFSKFHVLWTMVRFVLPTWWRRKDVIVCVGRPILIVGALFKRVFGCKFVYYSLEYSKLGVYDRWAMRQLDAYIDVERNRCEMVFRDYGLSIPSIVINNLPLLHRVPVKGGMLRTYLTEKYGVPRTAKIVVYAGSFQVYSCLPEIVAASKVLQEDVYWVLMAYNLPADLIAEAPANCFTIPPVSPPSFYDWLADADCSLLPYESKDDFNVLNCSPQKIFDCFLVGVPFVASNRPIVNEVLADSPYAGTVCDFTDVQSIVQAVQRMCGVDKEKVRPRMVSMHQKKYYYEIMAEKVRQLILE